MQNFRTNHQHIGQCLKDARKGLHISRKCLAKKLGTSRHRILSYEIGTEKIPTDTLTDLLCEGIINIINTKA